MKEGGHTPMYEKSAFDVACLGRYRQFLFSEKEFSPIVLDALLS